MGLVVLAAVTAGAAPALASPVGLSRAGFITDFLVLGPIASGDLADDWPAAVLGDSLVDPANADGAIAAGSRAVIARGRSRPRPSRDLELTWRPVRGAGPELDLEPPDERDQLAFLFTELVVDEALDGWLTYGGDDYVVAWLDGAPLPAPLEGGGLVRDHVWVSVRLEAGRHALCLALYNDRRRWAAAVRLVDHTLRPPAGVRVELPGAEAGSAALLDRLTVELTPRFDVEGGAWLELNVANAAGGGPPGVVVCLESEAPAGVDGGGPVCWPAEALAAAPRRVRLPVAGLARGPHSLVVHLSVPGLAGADRRVELTQPWEPLAAGAVLEGLAALASIEDGELEPPRGHGSLDCYAFEIARLREEIERGDDLDDLREGARALETSTASVRAGDDPWHERRGAFYRAYRSEIDGRLQPYAVFVPASWRPGATLPLVVSLHGMGHVVMQNLRHVLGFGDGSGPPDAPPTDVTPGPGEMDAIVVAPWGFGDAIFRFMGEADILTVMAEIEAAYPIDRDRVYLTGLSMGGIGSFDFGLHHASRFAGILSLAGMADMHRYREIRRYPLEPWEEPLIDELSSITWAANAVNTPLFAIHGTEDGTDEINSSILVDRLRELGYTTGLETPRLDHDVWTTEYAHGGLMARLGRLRRDPFPERAVVTTATYRYATQAWVTIDRLDEVHRFATVEARLEGHRARLEVTATAVRGLTLRLNEAPTDWRVEPLTVRVEGASVCEGACWRELHVVRDEAGRWREVVTPESRVGLKRAGLEGPVYDAWYGRLAVVYGTADAALTPLLERLAHGEAGVRAAVDIALPVWRDVDVTAERMLSHHLIVFGTPASNTLLADVSGELPIEVVAEGMRVGERVLAGEHLTAVFVVPNPRAPERYLIVKTGTSALGLDGIRFAPRYLPDFVVFDERARTFPGWRTFRGRPVLEGGFFEEDWTLP